MRKLSSIQKIKEVFPIPDADRLELFQVLGWKCVGGKGEFHVGDLVVYFEIDSFLPVLLSGTLNESSIFTLNEAA